jgi:type I restriction enzyme M protein
MDTLFDLPQEPHLLKKFEEIHDFIYSHDGLSPQETLEEIVKILFIKMYDETLDLHFFTISSEEWEKISSGDKNVNLEKIVHLFELTKQEYSSIFEPHDKIKLSLASLGFVIGKLQNISFLDSSQDAKGLAFQKFLTNHEKHDRGQYFTPEPVVNFCVQMLSPKPDMNILDPACGSCGFLLSALNFMRENAPNTAHFDGEQAVKHLFGVEINKSIARIATMKLLLEHNGPNNVFCYNSLDDIDSLNLLLHNTGGFDMILTNPPFGAKINQKSVLNQFSLGYKWSKQAENRFIKSETPLNNQSVETLFIERCIALLKTGGKMAIVLPNGNFENPSLEYVRFYIKKMTKILAVINLPQETFIPYGTGVKTSLLFLEKRDAQNAATRLPNESYPVFFGRITKLGYQGNKNGTPAYKKNEYGENIRDAAGKQQLDEDMSEMLQLYRRFLSGDAFQTKNAFSLMSNEIKSRFDFDFYSPDTRSIIKTGTNSVKLGDICDIVKVKSPKLKQNTGLIEYIELSDINTHSYEIINSNPYNIHDLPSRASYELSEGDIITAIAGNSVGTRKHATALVPKHYAGCICTNGFRILRNATINPYYLLYFMKTEKFLRQMFMYRTGAAIPAISDTDLANVIIEIPDNGTLETIVSKMNRIFALRTEAQQEFETITALHQNAVA